MSRGGQVIVSSAPSNPWYERIIKEPASGAVHEWSKEPLFRKEWFTALRPWPFGTIVRRTARNLGEITSARGAKAADERVLVVTDGGDKHFQGLVLNHSSIPVGQVADKWVAEYWEPDE